MSDFWLRLGTCSIQDGDYDAGGSQRPCILQCCSELLLSIIQKCGVTVSEEC